MLNTLKQNAFRSRADIAHELGHLLLHRYVRREFLDDPLTFKLMEKQAWRFAQGFLLPEQPFLKDVYSLSLDTLLSLKPKWKVSVAFMLQRIFDLDIIGIEKYGNYRKYLAQRNWLRSEPYDAETKPEQPLMLWKMVEYLRDQRIQTPEQLISSMEMNPAYVEQLLQTPTGFFTSPNIIFTPKQRVI